MKNTMDYGICKLLEEYSCGEEKVKIVYESEYFLAAYSPKPFAEVHVFIAAKPHINSFFDLAEEDQDLVIDMMKAIKAASQEVISLKGACKVEMYLGAFQNTKHLHCHVIYDSSIE